MDSNAIQVAGKLPTFSSTHLPPLTQTNSTDDPLTPRARSVVRVRPLTGSESARIPEESGDTFFMGDGHLGGSTPSKPGVMGGMWREVVGESSA
jgi:hypothetical protein